MTRHGFGYSVFGHTEDGIASELLVYVAIEAPVKFVVLKLRNESGRARRLSVTGYLEWVLGDEPTKTRMHVSTGIDAASGALFARNPYNTEFAGRTAFFVVDDAAEASLCVDRAEFIGRNGTLRNPAAMTRPALSGTVGAALDPCAAIRVPLDLAAGQTREIVFRLGAGASVEEARQLVQRWRGADAAHDALTAVKQYWQHTLGAVQVETPNRSLDVLTNGWLVYQILACRLWARNAFYQSSGAFGFRDQLQDVMALVHAAPELVHEHLLRCASRQFPEGDVQHWWHPPSGRGVRTRCSDDYLWLPLAACRYVMVTGDAIEQNSWDGAWYRRAWFDDGSPLGTSSNAECRIDSIAQSWSALSGAGEDQRARMAMDAVDQQLVHRDAALIQLLDPPFDHSDPNPGYIQGYVRGVRENGGQYTHAAVWAAMAFAALGDAERAWELFTMISPINHAKSPDAIAVYKTEPYVLASDVYALAPHTGRGGWTWYTGSAGWM